MTQLEAARKGIITEEMAIPKAIRGAKSGCEKRDRSAIGNMGKQRSRLT